MDSDHCAKAIIRAMEELATVFRGNRWRWRRLALMAPIVLFAAWYLFPLIWWLPLSPACSFGTIGKDEVSRLEGEASDFLKGRKLRTDPFRIFLRDDRNLVEAYFDARLEFLAMSESLEELYARDYAFQRAIGGRYLGAERSNPRDGAQLPDALVFRYYHISLGSLAQVPIFRTSISEFDLGPSGSLPPDTWRVSLIWDLNYAIEGGHRLVPERARDCPDLSILPPAKKIQFGRGATIDLPLTPDR